jgi:negative regulator of genetic competence, sporulation and motility
MILSDPHPTVRRVPFKGPDYDQQAEVAHRSTFLQSLVAGKQIWDSKKGATKGLENSPEFVHIMWSFSENLTDMIRYLKTFKMDDEYMELMVHHESYSCAAWCACMLAGDQEGQSLVEARIREGWSDSMALLKEFQSMLDTWVEIVGPD